MIVIKWIILLSIFLISSLLGIMFANKYKDREKEYTYEPLPQIFLDIGKEFDNEVRRNF